MRINHHHGPQQLASGRVTCHTLSGKECKTSLRPFGCRYNLLVRLGGQDFSIAGTSLEP